MLRGLHRILDPRRSAAGLDTSAVTGFVISNGNGNKACARAAMFARLGYPSLALPDNDDRDVDSCVAPAEQAGAQIVRWDHGMDIEHQLAHDLDPTGLQELVDLANAQNDTGIPAIRDSIQSKLTTAVALPGHTVAQWAGAAAGGLAEIKVAIGQTAHKNSWFKREDHGEVLAGLIDQHWDALAGRHHHSRRAGRCRPVHLRRPRSGLPPSGPDPLISGVPAAIVAAAPCSVELPAGTGKTELVAQLAAAVAVDAGCSLILTHTHAGGDAMRRRLRRHQVPVKAATVTTIDAWSFNLARRMPLIAETVIPVSSSALS